jgi:hypothetical protein
LPVAGGDERGTAKPLLAPSVRRVSIVSPFASIVTGSRSSRSISAAYSSRRRGKAALGQSRQRDLTELEKELVDRDDVSSSELSTDR